MCPEHCTHGWVLVSEPGFLLGFGSFIWKYFLLPDMKPRNNTIYCIQYLTISFMLDLQEIIYNKVKKTYYMLAGSAGQHVVVFWDLNINIFLEVQDKKYS